MFVGLVYHLFRSATRQCSVLGPVLYVLFTTDLPQAPHVTIATFADDTAAMATDDVPETASQYLQVFMDLLEGWLNTWRIRVNENKSSHVTFTLRRKTCPGITLCSKIIPQSEDIKYLGLRLDRRLTWRKHILAKRKQLDIQFKKMYWLLGRKSKLWNRYKLLLYKMILKPSWTYGLQLWGVSSKSNVKIIERFQNKLLRNILNIPQYISNKFIYRDLKIETVGDEIMKLSKNYQERLYYHPNHLALNLLDNGNVVNRLKRMNTLDLIHPRPP